MERSYISDSSDFESFSSDRDEELDTSMIMKKDKEESNNEEIATRDTEVNFVITEKDKIANSTEEVDLETAMSIAEPEDDKMLVTDEEIRYVDGVDLDFIRSYLENCKQCCNVSGHGYHL